MPGVTKDRRGYEPHHEQAHLANPAAACPSADAWRLGIAIERVIAPTKLRTTCRLLLLAALLIALPLVVEATPLHDAARASDVTKVKHLITVGAGVNANDDRGLTPLHWAARHETPAVAALLIQHGAEVNVKNKRGVSPLEVATWHNAQKTVALLLENGADPNFKDASGSTPLYTAILKTGAVETIAALIEHGADVNAPVGSKTNSKAPLFWAIAMQTEISDKTITDSLISVGVKKSIAELIANRASDTRVANYRGEEIVAMLLAAGADANAKGVWGRTPLHEAAAANARRVVELLIEAGADVNAKQHGGLGTTPLAAAISRGAVESLAVLIEHGADVNAPVGHNNQEPLLFWAVAERWQPDAPSEAITAALISAGADVNAKREKDGMTPLHHAAHENDHHAMELLIAAGADVNARDDHGRTPLAAARSSKSHEAIALLQRHNAH